MPIAAGTGERRAGIRIRGGESLVSCLTVTRECRLASLRLALGDYRRQTHTDRELVIVHDGSAAFHDRVEAVARTNGQSDVTVHRASPGLTLGQLRNIAVGLAAGTYVCQWDDDDRYHPRRLEVQLQALRADDGDFCFLTDQLHLFADTGTLYWDDWTGEIPPLDVVQGTLLGRTDKLPAYPALGRGEDTAVVRELVALGHRVTRLHEHGYLYAYVFDGGNVWDYGHHSAISARKRLRGARLLRRISVLKQRLAEYDPPLPALTMPCELGALVVDPANDVKRA